MIVLEDNCLEFRFDEVHPAARCSIGFQRTLRIPDDGRDYPLPPGLGRFPLRHLDDYAARLPESRRIRGGVLAPMHQAEAMWINFHGTYPFAVKVATGKICAITGEPRVERLNRDPQDYVVLPEQPWLDGYCVEEGVIRQFVAMPLGEGYTVEEQLTGASVHGGVQLVAYPMKADRYEALRTEWDEERYDGLNFQLASSEAVLGGDMGLAPGGRMKQQIYDDPYGLDAWDQRHASRCFVTLLNTTQWMAITAELPPTVPPTARDYAAYNLPWFDYYDADARAVAGSDRLRGLTSVARRAETTGQGTLPDNETVPIRHVVGLGKTRRVRESVGDPA